MHRYQLTRERRGGTLVPAVIIDPVLWYDAILVIVSLG